MEGITEHEYPNGLRVLLYPGSANPKVTVNVRYLVGSRHEGYRETGMAHLLVHMDFIETNDGRQIRNEIVARGAAWNGTTSDDRTNHFETVTATDENLRWALDMEAARMVNVKIIKQPLDVEMTVVRNEFERGENSPQRALGERVASTAFLWHNYGKSTIGSREDITKAPAGRLLASYKKYYQPDNAVPAIAGKIDEAKTLAWVAETVGRIPRPARQLDATYTVEPAQDGIATWNCGGWAKGRSGSWRTIRRRRRIRIPRRCRCWRGDERRRWGLREGTSHQGAGGRQEGRFGEHAGAAAA